MNGISKRTRLKNFTVSEEKILNNLILVHQDVIESKETGSIIWGKKAEAWKEIAADFALQSGMERPWQALREKYTNNQRLKRRKTPSENGDDDIQRIEHKLSISAVSSLAEAARDEESSIDLHSEYNSMHTPSEIKFEPETCNNFVNNIRVDHKMEDYSSTNVLMGEKLALLKLQQKYYRSENSRAVEKHIFEMEVQKIQLAQRKLEMEKYNLDIEKVKVEIANMHLQNKLLEIQIQEKEGNINGKYSK
ncbi:myb/SANT-like DNA-binding domain-containing protein 4 [Drosophila eugracilis]|uniref:myb/SANT-like DNA-binding domain-containing protein 4 n=1 Tax=Drosophila eugracilis TaxID=29029 RepID=UPI001BD9DFD5|nr:myb/SANT-like DNA-binding domain-containing protein 4 [Drosophila eugracilis]